MIYEEIKQNVVSTFEGYYYVNLISADFITEERYPNYMDIWGMCGMIGDCFMADSVLYLVITERYYQKPTYKSIKEALEEMKKTCELNRIKKIVLPKIDCVMSPLVWSCVRKILFETFIDTDIDILVCEK